MPLCATFLTAPDASPPELLCCIHTSITADTGQGRYLENIIPGPRCTALDRLHTHNLASTSFGVSASTSKMAIVAVHTNPLVTNSISYPKTRRTSSQPPGMHMYRGICHFSHVGGGVRPVATGKKLKA